MKKKLSSIQNYPERFVSPDVMNHAKSIYDILDSLQYDISENKIVLRYINNGMSVNLGQCSYSIYDSYLLFSDFYTANLNGFGDIAKQRIRVAGMHVLESPIAHIGKEIFSRLLDICREKNVTSMRFFPLAHSNSLAFYQKMMQKYFPDRIKSLVVVDEHEMNFLLS